MVPYFVTQVRDVCGFGRPAVQPKTWRANLRGVLDHEIHEQAEQLRVFIVGILWGYYTRNRDCSKLRSVADYSVDLQPASWYTAIGTHDLMTIASQRHKSLWW